MALIVSQHPELVDLTHHEARDFAEPLVSVFVAGFLIFDIQNRRGDDKMLV
jgi:hypothetical protein